MKGYATVGGIILVAVLLAGLGDVLAHPAGTTAAFKGVDSILSTSYKAAAGGYSNG